MTCLKCGRETDETFCKNCQEVMEKYPVKPGSIILLPKPREMPQSRRTPVRRNTVAPEVKIAGQRRIIRRLSGAVASLLVLVCVLGFALFRQIHQSSVRPVGQNYSTATKPSEETTEAPSTVEQTIPEAQTEEET